MANVFKSRAPRDRVDIEICLEMLEDSPFWDPAYNMLTRYRNDLVTELEKLLRSGQAYIDILENESYHDTYIKRKPREYTRNFHSVWFIFYVTRDFAREIIREKEADEKQEGDGKALPIADAGWHFLQSLVEHSKSLLRKGKSVPCPAATVTEMMRGHNQMPGHGLYCFNFYIWHPCIDISTTKYIEGSQPYDDAMPFRDRVWASARLMHGGLVHDAWINNVAAEVNRYGYENAGHQELRAYPGNALKSDDSQIKYLFCLTKDKQTSKDLGVRDNVNAHRQSRPGSVIADLFLIKRPKQANLDINEQVTCYLIALGYSPEQIADVMIVHNLFRDSKRIKRVDVTKAADACLSVAKYDDMELFGRMVRRVNTYQNTAGRKLRKAGLLEPIPTKTANDPVPEGRPRQGYREHIPDKAIEKAILTNMHEVRSLIVPLYPWPEDLFLG